MTERAFLRKYMKPIAIPFRYYLSIFHTIKHLKNINLSNVHSENMVNIQHMTNNSHKMTISHTLINEKL